MNIEEAIEICEYLISGYRVRINITTLIGRKEEQAILTLLQDREKLIKENMLTALSKTETVDELEKAKKLEMQINMIKILNNYDEVIQIFIKNKNKEDFER